MSVEDHSLSDSVQGPAPIVFAEPEVTRQRFSLRRRRQRGPRPRVRKLRLLMVLIAFLGLAFISLVFGMLTSLASDLPKLDAKMQFRHNLDSYLYDQTGQPIGVLAPATKPVVDTYKEISPNMINAIVSVEDKRFWTDPGVDLKGLARAALSDLTGGQYEGASTIAEQFVKQIRQAEGKRTVAEKLVEAGLAFQLVHQWKRTHIITEYLNTIYFGNGANGIEAAARVYFGWNHGYNPGDPGGEGKSGCGDPSPEDPGRKECASVLEPWEAALLAGMVANPSEFDPIVHPVWATQRRNQVLSDMYQQHYISYAMYEKSIHEPLPTAKDIQQPEQPAAAPYFTSWVTPLIERALKKEGVKDPEYEAYYGGLKIKLTINLKMQAQAQAAVNDEFSPGSDGPTASLVAIDNSNGEVRAMVSGDGNYAADPFNLATFGYRQPGSAFKMFTLAAALSTGEYGPDSVFDSKPLRVPYKTSTGRTAYFVVHNFDNAYAGSETLATATAVSDNSVFTQLGMDVGTQNVKKFAIAMGIRSPISTTPAMILGGLTTGVSALDIAHAYETAANGGLKVYNKTLGDYDQGAIGIDSISGCSECHQSTITNAKTMRTRRVLSPEVASTIDDLLHGPVDDPSGTGTAAAIPGVDVVGKTGTTSNYVDAWFVGWTPQMTVAVWVGYPNSGKAMLKNFDGGPVEGGTFPAIIWHNYVVQALQILQEEQTGKKTNEPITTEEFTQTAPTSTTTSSSTATDQTAPDTQNTAGTNNGAQGNTNQTNNGTGGQQQVTTTPATEGTQPTGVVTTQAPTTTPAVTPTPTTVSTTPATTTAPSGTSGGTGL